MAINMHLPRMFFAVVERGGFSQAAVTLNVSQSAVSRGVKELEGQLGGPLLERHLGMRPTETGAVLPRNAQRLFADERRRSSLVSRPPLPSRDKRRAIGERI